MLHLYNVNHTKEEGLMIYKDYYVESVLSTGDKTLSFSYPILFADSIKEEAYIRTKTDEFVIKEIEKKDDYIAVKALLNVEDLEGTVWNKFESETKTISECLTAALVGTGWTLVDCSSLIKQRTIKKMGCSSWDILQDALTTYRVFVTLNSINKTIAISESLGTDKGAYLMDGLNIDDLSLQGNSYDFYTRIRAFGKDGLSLGAPGYIENYQYSNKIKTMYWKDERYTDVTSLTEDATAKLEDVSKPYRAYKVRLLDLAKLSLDNPYINVLLFNLGDIITLVSKNQKIKEKQRIVKYTEYPDEPEKNNCEIANAILSLENYGRQTEENNDTINNLIENNGTISQQAMHPRIYTGTTVPSNDLGQEGDVYIQYS